MPDETIPSNGPPDTFSAPVEYPAIGEKLAKYELIGELGTGGQAKVYKARDPDLDRLVAIKVLHFGSRAPKNFRDRFLQEVKVQANLKLNGVIPLFECGQTKEWLYFVMELVEGENIDNYCERLQLHWRERVDLVARLARLIARLHDAGLVHRDIKPGNVMIDAHGDIKLLDLGLVKSLEAKEDVKLTQTGGLVGTPGYMAPEQALVYEEPEKRNASHPASDVYAIAVLAYELICGELPYDISHLGLMEILFVIKNEPPAPMRKHVPDILPNAERVILDAMAKEPAQRPTAEEFASRLESALAEPARKSSSGVSPAIFLIVVILVVIGAAIIVNLPLFSDRGDVLKGDWAKSGGKKEASSAVNKPSDSPATPAKTPTPETTQTPKPEANSTSNDETSASTARSAPKSKSTTIPKTKESTPEPGDSASKPEETAEPVSETAATTPKAADNQGQASARLEQSTTSTSIARGRVPTPSLTPIPTDTKKPEWQARLRSLRNDPALRGKGALIYVLPTSSKLEILKHGQTIETIFQRVCPEGCFQASSDENYVLKLTLSDHDEPIVLPWSPRAGEADVLR